MNKPVSSKATSSPSKREDATAEQAPVAMTEVSAVKILVGTLVKYLKSLEEKVESDERYHLKLHDEVRHFEAEMIRQALETTGGRKRRAARLLGVNATTLCMKIKRYNLDDHD